MKEKQNMKQIIAIVGPTASGKTALSIKLAKALNTEIISADSRQFYKEMQIGTAVPEPDELAAAKHHFIQNKSIFDDYTVGDYEQDFLQLTNQLFQTKDTLILVGGSGLYIDAACKGLDNLPGKNEQIRKELTHNLNEKGIESLQQQLQALDPDYYQKIDYKNPHRLIRAIEILLQSGGKKMADLHQKKAERDFKTIYIGLTGERSLLYDRINKRVDIMINQGLVNEAKNLLSYRNINALQTVGYKELFSYFDGTYDLNFAISEIKKNTRRFAKRQLTWFRKNPEIKWFDIAYDLEEILKYLEMRNDLS